MHQGQVDFDGRYRREYLMNEKFYRFDEALVRLLDLLELPGIGKVLSGALYVVRTPYRLLKNLFHKATQRAETLGPPERPFLDQAWNGWMDYLRKEALQRAGTHPVWAHINLGFNSGLADLARQPSSKASRPSSWPWPMKWNAPRGRSMRTCKRTPWR